MKRQQLTRSQIDRAVGKATSPVGKIQTIIITAPFLEDLQQEVNACLNERRRMNQQVISVAQFTEVPEMFAVMIVHTEN